VRLIPTAFTFSDGAAVVAVHCLEKEVGGARELRDHAQPYLASTDRMQHRSVLSCTDFDSFEMRRFRQISLRHGVFGTFLPPVVSSLDSRSPPPLKDTAPGKVRHLGGRLHGSKRMRADS
jgi:hypothetical protein